MNSIYSAAIVKCFFQKLVWFISLCRLYSLW